MRTISSASLMASVLNMSGPTASPAGTRSQSVKQPHVQSVYQRRRWLTHETAALEDLALHQPLPPLLDAQALLTLRSRNDRLVDTSLQHADQHGHQFTVEPSERLASGVGDRRERRDDLRLDALLGRVVLQESDERLDDLLEVGRSKAGRRRESVAEIDEGSGGVGLDSRDGVGEGVQEDGKDLVDVGLREDVL